MSLLPKNSLLRMRVFSFLIGCLLLHGSYRVRAFTTSTQRFPSDSFPKSVTLNRHNSPSVSWPHSSSSSTSLSMGVSPSTSRVRRSIPSQAECESLGVREWPQQSKQGSWTESVAAENSVTRYVLEGTGSVDVVEDGGDSQRISIAPGTLVEIQTGTPSVRLEWSCDSSCPEIILLTPGFEEGNVFLGVIAGIFVLFGALLSGVLG